MSVDEAGIRLSLFERHHEPSVSCRSFVDSVGLMLGIGEAWEMSHRAPGCSAESGWTTASTHARSCDDRDRSVNLPGRLERVTARRPSIRYGSSGTRPTTGGFSMKTTSALQLFGARVKRFCALAIVVVLLTSCATQGDTARTEGTLAGAGVGAAVGAGLGYLISGNATGAGIGAAVGAAVGGGAGYAYADSIAKRHEALAGREKDLDARIAFAQGVNEDAQKYNLRLKNEIAERDQRITRYQSMTQGQEVAQRELAKEKQALSTRVNDANKQLAVAQGGAAKLEEIPRRAGEELSSAR